MLNPKKCVFGVVGKIFGFMVSHQGIEVNPHKIEAIEKMNPPSTIWGIQKLTWFMVSLSHFILKMGEKGLSFFKLLRNHNSFTWLEEAYQFFKDLKWYLSSPPILVAPFPKE